MNIYQIETSMTQVAPPASGYVVAKDMDDALRVAKQHLYAALNQIPPERRVDIDWPEIVSVKLFATNVWLGLTDPY